MLGVIVNTVAVIIGGLIGLLVNKGIPERFSKAIMIALGLCTMYIGISGALEGENTIVLVISLVLGAVVGTALKIDERLSKLGDMIESKLTSREAETRGEVVPQTEQPQQSLLGEHAAKNMQSEKTQRGEQDETPLRDLREEQPQSAESKPSIAQGFVTASLLFCVGAMAIVGSITSGLTGDHSIIFTKSILDFVAAAMLAVTFGFGVMLSGASVFVYQGILVLLAGLLRPVLENPAVLAEITSAGSVIIIALGLNIIGVTKVKVANYLPAIVFAPPVWFIAQLI